MRNTTALLALALLASPSHSQAPLCIPPAPVPATATADRPVDTFASEPIEYMWVHSGTNLQGAPAYEKYAPCLFYNPGPDTIASRLAGFRSALVVNNPSPTTPANVQIELYDAQGNVVPGATMSFTLPADGTFARGVPALQAGANGVGSARIKSDQPIVGASLHYADSVLIDRQPIIDPDHIGEGSMQQLQMAQADAKSLYAGPMPLSNTTDFDFLNGNLPFYCVLNTGSVATNLTVFKGTSNGGIFPTLTPSLPPRGLFIDFSIWDALEPIYLANSFLFDDNAWAWVISSASPIVGDLVLTDFFGGVDGESTKAAQFRFGTAMMASFPSTSLTNAELTFDTASPSPTVETLMGVLNASLVDIGPVSITFRDRDNLTPTTRTVASLPPGQTLRLTPGTPSYPAAPHFDGWVDVRACKPGLIGWTMRQVKRYNQISHPQKVYGEELVGANGAEPGDGIDVTVGGRPLIRKVAPLGRVSPDLRSWPSYMNFANNSVLDVGAYFYRFFQVLPFSADITDYTPQPFTTLPFGTTSFTFEDGKGFGAPSLNLIDFTVLPGGNQNVSGRVDITEGSVIGIDVMGDPVREWRIPDFPNENPSLP